MEKKAIKMWKKKWKVSNVSQRELLGYTVVIRFSARGAYLLLVRKGRAVIKNRELIFFSRNRACCIFENDEENWKTGLLFSIFPGENEKPTKSFV